MWPDLPRNAGSLARLHGGGGSHRMGTVIMEATGRAQANPNHVRA